MAGSLERSVTASIVNYNTAALLGPCLSALERSAGRLLKEVILVDNASTDGSAALVAKDFRRVRLIRNSENVGFARGHNQAFTLARSPYFLVLNSDAFMTDGSLAALVQVLEDRSEVALVGPRLIYPNGTRQPSTSPLPSLSIATLRLLGAKHLVPVRARAHVAHLIRGRAGSSLDSHLSPYLGHEPSRGPAPNLAGACVLVRMQAVSDRHLFDDAFFMYLEDADLCKRLREQGWSLWYEPKALVVHLVGASSAPGYRRSAQPLRSLVLYFRKHNGRLQAGLVAAIAVLSLVAEMIPISARLLGGRRGARDELIARASAVASVLRAAGRGA